MGSEMCIRDSSGITSYQVRVDAGDWTDIGNALTYTSISPVPDGGHVFYVRAVDGAQNPGTEASLAFEIDTTPPQVTVTSPNGGEAWAGGSTHDIRWTTVDSNKSTADIDYSVNSGTTWIPIVTSIPDTGIYNWTVPELDTSTVRVRVTATDRPGNTGGDTSNADFTVDSTGPIISDVSDAGTYTTGTTIIWATSEAATSRVEYGGTDAYGLTTPLDSAVSYTHLTLPTH